MASLTQLALGFKDIFPYPWLQIPGLIILVGLIVFWVMYRRKQM